MKQLYINCPRKKQGLQRALIFIFNSALPERLFERSYLQVRFILCLLFFVACSTCTAQRPGYYVYLIKGKATVKKADGKSFRIKQQDLLSDNDILSLKKGSELTLVDTSSNFVLLKTAGNYKVGALKSNAGGSTEGLTEKYFKQVWHELLEPTNDYTVFKKESLVELAGSVSRGRKCDNLIFPVNNMKTSEDTIHFAWLQTNDSGVYNFTIVGPKDKKLELPVSDTQYTMRMPDVFGQPTGQYCWLVKDKENTTKTNKNSTCGNQDQVCFDLITKESEARLVSYLVPQHVPNDLVSQLDIVNKLEKNLLIYRAIGFYSEMVKANPENKALLKSYLFFLLKYGFNEEALSTWNDLRK